MLKAKLSKGPIRVAGAMSGTSLDGVDVAVLETDGVAFEVTDRSAFRPYSKAEQATLRAALGKWTGDEVDAATEIVQAAHLEALSEFTDCDLIGFHGQTLAHEPRGRGTLQVGDGLALAEALKTPVAWDFRSADVNFGGEGAPLAPFFHFACAKKIRAEAPIVFLNLGGVGNVSWVDPRCTSAEDESALLAFDTGPANAPINDFMLANTGKSFDHDGATARKGNVELGALELFLQEAYFTRVPPKSLDRNDFSEMIGLVSELSLEDAVATLTAMSAAAVAQGMGHCPSDPEHVFVTGGGRHNPVLMEMLAVSLDCPVAPVEAVGLNGDMLEAQAFAYLAARVAKGMPTSSPATTGVMALVGGGVLSEPES